MIPRPFIKCLPVFLTILAAASASPCFADDLNREQLIASARAGGDYLIRMQKQDGSFHYTYDALQDRTGSETYNILRHAGTAYALLDLYATTRDQRYLDSAHRAIVFLKARFRPARGNRSSYVLDFDGNAKLGANGLALIALARQLELDPKRGDRASAERLAYLILSLQRKNGSFASYYRLHGKEPARVSLYYPGEAMLGLVQLFKLNGDRRLIEAVRRGADHLIAAQRNMDELPDDAWLMQALDGLHRVRKVQRYADHAIALAESMIAAQYTAESRHAGYIGGFGPGRPRATPAASRSEGIVAAYRMARATGDARATPIGAALKLAARFLLSQQFDIHDTSLLKPALAAGGFRESATSWQVRIDYVQHNIAALLGIAEALY
ncbi:MAG: hypothetical protein AABO41_16325 [Acidobacteriota bacterium]